MGTRCGASANRGSSCCSSAVAGDVRGACAGDGRRRRPRRCASSFSIAETSFDPQFASDAASDGVISNIYEQMLDYDYLARPVKLVPRTLEAMPDGAATAARRTSFQLRKGIFFTPDPAFKGKPRELTAADQVYGLKRLLDPEVKSPWTWLIDGKVVGSDEARAKAEKAGKFDYDAPIAGLEVVDRYTLRSA